MIAAIIEQIWPYILAAVALVGGWYTAKQQGRSEAKTDALIQAAEQGAKARKESQNVDKKIDAMGDDAIRDRAGKWVQDDIRSR